MTSTIRRPVLDNRLLEQLADDPLWVQALPRIFSPLANALRKYRGSSKPGCRSGCGDPRSREFRESLNIARLAILSMSAEEKEKFFEKLGPDVTGVKMYVVEGPRTTPRTLDR